jgi:two-component system response regulator HydG
VSVNCAALPETLLEDELFGHKRGAFTDAVSERPGRFVQADGGTLFLDEIGDMPLGLQAKLLRALQEREVTPLGGAERVKVDVRIIASTNQDLREALKERRFREDLYYRLNVIHIPMPALSERAGDVPLLVASFLAKFCAQNTLAPKRFSLEAMRILTRYPWPGNVRELENAVERAVTLSGTREVLDSTDLPEEIGAGDHRSSAADTPGGEDLPLEERLERIESRLVLEALESSGWVKSQAATRLGIKRTTLVEKMKRLGISLKRST